MLFRLNYAGRRLMKGATKYVLAVESEGGLQPAKFLDATAKETLEKRPGIFAKCELKVS